MGMGLSLRLGLGGASGGGLPAYEGVVATRGLMAGDTQAWQQVYTRTFHYARDDIEECRLFFSDWRGDTEAASGGTTTITASIEYPIGGSRTQVLFGGSPSGSLTSGGELLSDPVTISIPDGAKFYLRVYRTHPTGNCYTNYIEKNAAGGDMVQVWASGGTDYTMSGDPAGSGNAAAMFTLPAIIGQTTKPTFMSIGDSRTTSLGASPKAGNATGDHGEHCRALGANYAYIHVGIGGELVTNAVSNSAKRQSIAQYVSHVITNYGINDIRSAKTESQIKTAIETLYGQFSANGQKIYHSTIAPSEVSGSPEASSALRVTINNWLRALTPTGLEGCIEVADVVEEADDSGIWVPAYTTDLIHENATGYQAIEDANIFPTLSR